MEGLFLRACCTGLALATLLWSSGASAQKTAASAKATVPALFVSDIHFDPFQDPAKVPQLAKTPVAGWDALLGTAASATREKDFTALQEGCKQRGADTSSALWRSSLEAMHAQASGVSFVTVSGDLLAHSFDCKFKQVFPSASEADYVAFVGQTVRYLVQGMQTALPNTPIYVSMGNNDSGCGDYKDEPGSGFLKEMAKIVAEALPAGDRAGVQRDFANEGFFNAPLASVPNTRILVVDDLFLSDHYKNCADKLNESAPAAELQWLKTQLADAREKKQHVWVLGHIPPGVDLYATAKKMGNLCGAAKAQMFLGDEGLGELLAQYADVVRLAVFGHTHTDEFRLLIQTPASHAGGARGSVGVAGAGVPIKIVASISPVNGNRPTFTIAQIDQVSSGLVDYTVIVASNLTGIHTDWSKEYTFSETYHQPAFNGQTLRRLTDSFQGDAVAAMPESNAYLRFLFPGDRSVLLKPFWPEYACVLAHESAESYANCVCSR